MEFRVTNFPVSDNSNNQLCYLFSRIKICEIREKNKCNHQQFNHEGKYIIVSFYFYYLNYIIEEISARNHPNIRN